MYLRECKNCPFIFLRVASICNLLDATLNGQNKTSDPFSIFAHFQNYVAANFCSFSVVFPNIKRAATVQMDLIFTQLRSRRVVMCLIVVFVRLFVPS